MKTYSREQLERKYAQEIKNNGNHNYYDFVVDAYEMSCDPAGCLQSWMCEMKRDVKKDFLRFVLSYLDLSSHHNMMLVSRIIDEI
jgi:hypothetical protein